MLILSNSHTLSRFEAWTLRRGRGGCLVPGPARTTGFSKEKGERSSEVSAPQISQFKLYLRPVYSGGRIGD